MLHDEPLRILLNLFSIFWKLLRNFVDTCFAHAGDRVGQDHRGGRYITRYSAAPHVTTAAVGHPGTNLDTAACVMSPGKKRAVSQKRVSSICRMREWIGIIRRCFLDTLNVWTKLLIVCVSVYSSRFFSKVYSCGTYACNTNDEWFM